MMPKEVFWSGLKGGIFEQKHFSAMGNALWLFGWLCMRQSQINGSGEGLPHYGNPLTFKEISDDTGFSRRTIEKWTAVLTRTGYVHTKRIGNSGIIFFIHKAKQKAKNPKPSTRYFPAELQPNGNYAKATDAQVPANGRTPECQVHANEGARPRPLAYTHADKSRDSQSDTENATTLTPKSLSNYKTDSLAKNARSPLSSFKEVLKEKTVPHGMSQADLDARRRKLLLQGEEIKRKHAPREQPGQVVKMQPQEAIA